MRSADLDMLWFGHAKLSSYCSQEANHDSGRAVMAHCDNLIGFAKLPESLELPSWPLRSMWNWSQNLHQWKKEGCDWSIELADD